MRGSKRSFGGNVHAAQMSRPGADTRVWITLAEIKELGYDPTGGVYADVQFQPTGELETAYVGTDYAGTGFGQWMPPSVGDMVLVAVPMGDAGWGPVIIRHMWSQSAPPPGTSDLDWAPGAASLEPPTDVVLRMKPGVAYKLRGSGADIDIRVEGTGDVVIENLGTGKVKLGLASTAQPVALAPLVEAAIKAAVETAIAGHIHVIQLNAAAVATPVAPVPTLTGLLTPTTPYVAIVASTGATKTVAT